MPPAARGCSGSASSSGFATVSPIRLAAAKAEVARRADAEEASRGLVERMIADPEDYRWVRVSNEDVGEPGCKHWHSRPRFGIIGMLLGWWRVKLSSGCPLAGGRGAGRAPAPNSTRVHPLTEWPRSRANGAASAARASEQRIEPACIGAEPVRRPQARRRLRRQRRGRPSRANIDDQLPPAPWGSFPLVELTVLIGIVMLVLGFIFIGGQRGTVLIVTGLALASIGGLEVAVREHFAGFRSHTLILAGVPAAAALGTPLLRRPRRAALAGPGADRARDLRAPPPFC